MKLKSLLFGSAAAIVTVTGAQAADLPIAEPVEYVRICDAYGAGYYYIPGTETCLKIGGFVRFDMYFTPGDDDLDDEDDFDLFGNDSEDYNNFATRARGGINFDARTQTGLGILRSYIAIEGTLGPSNTGFYGDSGNDGYYYIDQAFMQLLMDSGTLTAGATDSFFDYEVSNAWNSPRFGDDDPYQGTTNLLAYTFAFGNGFSASLSIEDPRSTGRRAYGGSIADFEDVFGGKVDGVAGAFQSGQELPDFVANLRIDQGWGSAQVMGAIGKVDTYDFFGGKDDEGTWGWAVGAGATFMVPNTAFEAGLTARYADGLITYVSSYNGMPVVDAFYGYDGDLETATAWAVEGSIKAGLSERSWIALSGTYAHYEADGIYGVFDADDGEFDYDFNTWTAALTGGVDIVPGLFVGAELAYEKIDANLDFEDDYAPDPEDFSGDVDDDIWSMTFRMQRNF